MSAIFERKIYFDKYDSWNKCLLSKILNERKIYCEKDGTYEHNGALIISDQEYQDYKSKYLTLYRKHQHDKEVVSVLNDVDFCIELMESNRINVAYIMNLIRNINFDDPVQKDYDIKHIEDELARTDNPLMMRKVELLQSFLNRVVRGLNSADEIDAALDAIVLACSTQGMVQYLSTISAKIENYEFINGKKPRFKKPWETFNEDLEIALSNIFVSRTVNAKVSGQIFQLYNKFFRKETITI